MFLFRIGSHLAHGVAGKVAAPLATVNQHAVFGDVGGHERGRHGGNGSEGTRDANGADPADAHQPDDSAPPDTTVS